MANSEDRNEDVVPQAKPAWIKPQIDIVEARDAENSRFVGAGNDGTVNYS